MKHTKIIKQPELERILETHTKMDIQEIKTSAGEDGISIEVSGEFTGGGNSKLTAEEVIKMRQEHKRGDRITIIAERYDVTYAAARNAIKGKTWSELDDLESPV